MKEKRKRKRKKRRRSSPIEKGEQQGRVGEGVEQKKSAAMKKRVSRKGQ